MGATENNELEYQIIETAKQLFIEKGFVETSMSDIAAKVGINRPTLHYYFRTKDRMFQAVFGSIVMSLLPKVQEIIQQELPFIDRVSRRLDKYISLFTENPDIPKFICGEI
ncbi:TetR/AcrR family transcriptional regulator, partial [Bacteroides sp.]|uniref:TetR/AcrR family transcriptional regulator n=1 Tax=Bacteroides sp. TaxID=29523 RepID=UPI003AB6283B